MSLVMNLLAVVLPVGATYAFSGLKKLLPVIDRQSAVVQQIGAVLFAAGATWVMGHVPGVTLPLDVHQWDQAAILGLLNGLAALGAHAIRKDA